MTASYRVDLDVGDLSWSIERGDAPQLPEVLAPFRTGWAMPESDVWPVQPDPQVAVFSLLAEDAADLASVEIGAAVHARFYGGATGPNLIPAVDSTFEGAGFTWAANSGATAPARTTFSAHGGVRSLFCQRGAGTSALHTQLDIAGLLSAAGEYELVAWAYVPIECTGDNGLTVRGSGVPVNTDAFATTRAGWEELRIPFTYLGAGAVTISVYGAGATPKLLLDDVEVRELQPAAVFIGTVGALDGAPRRFAHPDTGAIVDGWQLDVQAVDYTARLGEANVSGAPQVLNDDPGVSQILRDWVLEYLVQTGSDLSTLAADIPAWYGDGDATIGFLTITEAAVPSASLRDAMEGVLRQVADTAEETEQGLRRAIVRANLDAAGDPDPDLPWVLDWVSRRNPSSLAANTLPARFGALGGGLYGLTLDPLLDDRTTVLDAGYLDRGVTWSRAKSTEPDRVIVTTLVSPELAAGDTWRQVSATIPGAGPAPITAQVADTWLTFSDDAQRLADMYLDDELSPDTVWQPAGFTWWACEDPSWPRRPSWFPEAPIWLGWAVPVVISGVPDSQSPNQRPWQVGIPQSVDLVIDGGRFRFDLTLRPRVPRPYNNGSALTWDDLAADFPAVTHDQIDPTQTSTDYRLAHTTALD